MWLSLLYFVLVLVILPIFCSDKIYSVHYQEDEQVNEAIDSLKAESRKRGVLEYLMTLNSEKSLAFHKFKGSGSVDNLIIVIAKHPSDKDALILSQLVTELDRNIRAERFYKNALLICNATRIPFGELSTLARFYPVKQAENTTTWKMFNKEEIIKHDFVECLDMGVNHTRAKHVTIIRDKVVPYSGFLEPLNHVISTQISKVMQRGDLHEVTSSWLFMHLQEPVPFRHYSLTLGSTRELFLIACIGSLFFYFVFRYLERQHQPSFSTCTYIFFGALYFLTFALVIGRPYVSELRRLAGAFYRVYDPPEPIHFSALTMPVSSINELLLQLNQLRCSSYFPFHKVLDNMINTLEKPGYVISPSLVRYVTKT